MSVEREGWSKVTEPVRDAAGRKRFGEKKWQAELLSVFYFNYRMFGKITREGIRHLPVVARE